MRFDAVLAEWLWPIWAAWILGLPVVSILAHGGLGRLAFRVKILATAVETQPPAIIRAASRYESVFFPSELARFRDIILDPVLNATRRVHLEERYVPRLAALGDSERMKIGRRAIEGGPAQLSRRERSQVLEDSDLLLRLHMGAWRAWPTETWALPRPVR